MHLCILHFVLEVGLGIQTSYCISSIFPLVQLHLLHDDVVQLEVEFELEVELMQINYFILQLHFVVESSPPSSLISVSRAMQLRCFQGSPSLHPSYNVIYDFQIFIYSLQCLQHKCSAQQRLQCCYPCM